ncbi:hypothetical protein B0J13DRAFT_59208 [Dactylonectria estremocensis]|uniref:Geranylgeranyl pyrophosphate synthetase n=1 Tax=Dactylonectria estremocensis TaxID=1079267 RepID=A0A9P9EPU2_9HYPO|nr:hypothetical protein B0J13DRAFT_59208 [Dactylonectria estremocensis]
MYSNRYSTYERQPRQEWGRRAPVSTSPTHPLGEVIETISKDSLADSKKIGRAEISGTKLIASYNWIADSAPKIMIPGKPPRYTPPRHPPKLSWDAGDYYRDRNAASYPKHPLEPAVVSIMKMNPEPMPVNIVACSSTIGNLLRFSRGEEDIRPFRILVEVIGDAVHLVRRENSPKELIPDVKGFGHTFPEAYTTWDGDARRSTSHQRIVKYNFGGLDMMVRFEGDGFVASPDIKQPKRPSAAAPAGNAALLDLANLGLEKTFTRPKTEDTQLKVVEGGQTVPQDAIFDLKTRSANIRNCQPNRDTIGEQLHRLWVCQIERFILAYHEKSVFNDIRIKDVKARVKDWETVNQPCLKSLAALLHLIIDRARNSVDGKLEIVSSAKDLQIRKQASGAGDTLSTSVRAEWATWLGTATRPSAGATPWNSSKAESDLDDEKLDSFSDLYESDDDNDYTACDKECGYCGRCMY